MKIGIDFDNTIAKYDLLFYEVARKKQFIPKEQFDLRYKKSIGL